MHRFESDKSNKKLRGYYKSEYLTKDILHPSRVPELFSYLMGEFLQVEDRFEFLKCESCCEKDFLQKVSKQQKTAVENL